MKPVPLRRLLTVFDDARPNGYRTPEQDGAREYHFVAAATGAFVPRPLLGDVYVRPYHLWCPWTNCDGVHLVVLIPSDAAGEEDPHEWSPQNRASNCTAKDDTLHRCWVTHGSIEDVAFLHVDKDGPTCTAGGGSIQFGDWHGYLQNGCVTTTHERREPRGFHLVVEDARGVLDSWSFPAISCTPFIPRDRQRRRSK